MDGFEARMKFAAIVRELSASISTSQRAASFALKWKEHDEDFHSIIIEQLEAVSLLAFCGFARSVSNFSVRHESSCQHHVFHWTAP